MEGESENGDGTASDLSGVDFTSRCFLWLLSLLAPAVLALRAGFAVRAFGAVHQQRK
jgi:hypothetical protein